MGSAKIRGRVHLKLRLHKGFLEPPPPVLYTQTSLLLSLE